MVRNIYGYVLIFVLTTVQAISVYGGVIATNASIENGRNNMADPQFARSVRFDTGVGQAVRFLVTGDPALGETVRIAILRAALETRESIGTTQAIAVDAASKKLYETLLMYDLVAQFDLFSADERTILNRSFRDALSFSMSDGACTPDEDSRMLGTTAMRVGTSCILYALNFLEDRKTEEFLSYGISCFEKNLACSIDDHGAWVIDSPGYAAEAVEYMIVAARALKNGGFQDFFSDSRLSNLLLYEMHLTPPQQCPLVANVYMIASQGQTDPGVNHGAHAVMASADIYPHFPDEASYLVWYWNQCGNPVEPLGVLLIDTSIPYMRPDGRSLVAGGGMAVLSDAFGTGNESIVFSGFGKTSRPFDRKSHNHADDSDFSFVWSGIPLIVHDGYSSAECSEQLINRPAWRHNLVLYEGAGDSPVIPENLVTTGAIVPDTTGSGLVPADFYPDGINQFLTTDRVDYVSGRVRLTRNDVPAQSYYRHILFLKPDALLVWDQIESQFPLEWNLWMPVSAVLAEGNVLKAYTDNNIELQILFAGDQTLDYSVDKLPAEITWDWPVVMSAPYGSGVITVVTPDLVTCAVEGADTFAMDVLHNLLSRYGAPDSVYVVTGRDAPSRVLDRFRIPYDRFVPGELSSLDLTGCGLLIIDDTGQCSVDDGAGKVAAFLLRGGKVLVFAGPYTDGGKERSVIPVSLTMGGCAIGGADDSAQVREILLGEDPVWRNPNRITADSWLEWVRKRCSGDANGDVRSGVTIPSRWSDSWNILASVRYSFPVKSHALGTFGAPSRIRVKHPASKDFFTLLLPRRTGRSYAFKVTQSGPGYIAISDPLTTWEINAGNASWTDANLAIRITGPGGVEMLYAFDCTKLDTGTDTITAGSPLSISYSPRDDSGVIMTAERNTIRHGSGELKLHAGEVSFGGLKGAVSLKRTTFVTCLRVVDASGVPVMGARVYRGGGCIGETDDGGRLRVRWRSARFEVIVSYGGVKTAVTLEPGTMDIVLALTR